MAEPTRDPAGPAAEFGATDLELLAAFVEGSLDGQERARVIARLAEDEGYEELLQDMLEITGDDGRLLPELLEGVGEADQESDAEREQGIGRVGQSPDHQAKVLRGPWRRATPWVAGLAAVLVAGLGLRLWAAGANVRQIGGLLAEVDRIQTYGELPDPISRHRGGPGDPSQLDLDLFDLGRLVVDLQLAVRRADTKKLRLHAKDAVVVSRPHGYLMPQSLQLFQAFEEAAEIEPPAWDQLRRQHAEAWRTVLEESEAWRGEFYFAYGAWSRTCELRFRFTEPKLPADAFPATDLADFLDDWRDSEFGYLLSEIVAEADAGNFDQVVRRCQMAGNSLKRHSAGR